MSSPVKVYSASNLIQAHALCNLLDDEGIEPRLCEHQETGGAFQDYPEIYVASEDAIEARAILVNWERDSREKSSLKSVESLQFGLIGILVNITVFACVFAIASLAKDQSATNVITPTITGIVFANLCYIAYYRRKRQRFTDEELEPTS